MYDKFEKFYRFKFFVVQGVLECNIKVQFNIMCGLPRPVVDITEVPSMLNVFALRASIPP